MQKINWYIRRLCSMSPREVAWRCRCKLQDAADRLLVPGQAGPPPVHRIVDDRRTDRITEPDVLGRHLGSELSCAESDGMGRWKSALLTQADLAVDHRLRLFDIEGHSLGDPIDWNHEPKAGKRTPERVSSSIDYRDYDEVGDCKFVWEPNRHHHLVVLGRAYRLTGDRRYAEAVVNQLDDWIRQCPYGLGMNWRSPLELAIRLINWIWAITLIDGSKLMTPDRRDRLLGVAYQHLHEITRKYSRFSSANNHLIGEAAGVFIASSYFPGFKQATRWREQSREILLHEIVRQTYPDGGNREHATGYHLFVLEFLTLVALVARNAGDELTPLFWDHLERMYDFLATLSEGGDEMPMIGDSDDGYVLDLGGRGEVVQSFLCTGAVLFDRADFKERAGSFREAAYWLFGPESRNRFEALDVGEQQAAIRSKALPESGLFLLQRGRCGAPDRISAVLDSGDLGFLSIAAHGHADALSLHLRVAGVDVLVDPGTYDYFTYPIWRCYFRSTRAHNTVVVDNEDQSQMLGSFMWGRKARCRRLRWSPTERGGVVSAEHDGYKRLSDPVIHRRTVTLLDDADELTVLDELSAAGRHDVAIHWHFSESCRLASVGDNCFEVDFGAGSMSIVVDSALSVSTVSGSDDPILGWVSRGYHRKLPGTTLVGRCTINGNASLLSRMVFAVPFSTAASAPL